MSKFSMAEKLDKPAAAVAFSFSELKSLRLPRAPRSRVYDAMKFV